MVEKEEEWQIKYIDICSDHMKKILGDPKYAKIFDCHGDKCKVHWDDGYGNHCRGCFGELSEEKDEE